MEKIFGDTKLVDALKESLKLPYTPKNEIQFDKALRGILDQISQKIGLYPQQEQAQFLKEISFILFEAL